MNSNQTTIKRIVISSEDFEESLSYLREAKEDVIRENVVVRRALIMMAVISYCRPFKKNHGNTAASIISNDFVCQLDGDMKAFHDFLIELRDNVFAHSNSEVKSVTVESTEAYNFFSLSFDSKLSWGKIEFEKLEKIVNLAFFFCNKSFGSAKV